MKLLQLISLIVLSQCVYSIDHVITCPKAFRLGAKETVYLDLYGYASGATVSAFLQDLPDRENVISVPDQVLDADAAAHPIEIPISIQPHNIRTFRTTQRVRLTIEVAVTQGSGAFTQTLDILVVPESGYLFVITNQPVYKPGDDVLIKAFVLNQTLEKDPTKIRVLFKTPDGIGTQSQIRFLQPGNNFAEDLFRIGSNPEFGLWSVEVTYALSGYETKAEAFFLVERFVLPTFQVSVVMSQDYVLLTDDMIEGEIRAVYSYGEQVQGSLYLSIKVKISQNSDRLISREFYTVPEAGFFSAFIQNGVYPFSASIVDNLRPVLEAENTTIAEVAANGGAVYVEATVTETGSGHLEHGTSPDVPVIATPHYIDLTRTSFYYISTRTYTLQADILFAIGDEPASGVQYSIAVNNGEPGAPSRTEENGQINSQIDFPNPPPGTPPQPQRVVIRIGENLEFPDAEHELTVTPYRSDPANPKYLQIVPEQTREWTVGNSFQFRFVYNQAPAEIRFFVIARGTIVYAATNYPINGNVESAQTFTVLQNMVPEARVVGYYLVGSEIVSGSLWFDVEDRCRHNNGLTISLDHDQIQPGDPVNIRLQGAPNALVSVTAVDRAAYFIFNGSRLTSDSVYEKMASYDQGCSRSGGFDGPGVFFEAGLVVSTSSAPVSGVYELACPNDELSRRKRQVTLSPENVQGTSDGTLDYTQARLVLCGLSGKFESYLDGQEDNCTTRANRCRNYLENVADCCDVFEQICEEEERIRIINALFGNVGRTGANSVIGAAGSVQDIRRNFEQNMVFRNIRLDGTGNTVLFTPSEDSITTFEIDAVSMESSSENGFCVAKTKNLRIFRDIFVQVYAPYALKKREQGGLRIAVFNYGSEDATIIVDVRPPSNTELCTHFQPEVWTQLLRPTVVGAGRSISSTITFLPLRVGNGETSIDFRVRFRNNTIVDVITQPLRIEEVGEVLETTRMVPIDLINRNEQKFELRFDFPESFVPGSRQCWIYAYPNFMGPSIEVDPLDASPRNIDSIFRMPRGCGEQTMIYAGPNVYAHMYLEATDVLVADTPAWDASIKRNRDGYTNELKYRSNLVNKRAWSVFYTYPPSTWLNAFVDKVFIKAYLYDKTLDLSPVCSSLNWLLEQQTAEGEFVEHARVIHREMHGGIGGSLTLTSYVVISMLETQSECSTELSVRIHTAVANAVNYLIANEYDNTLQTTYGLSVFAYALALHQPETAVTRRVIDRLLALRIVGDNEIHWQGRSQAEIAGTDVHAYWYQQKPLAIHIEATAYALLALVEREKHNNPPSEDILDITRKTVLWLIGRRNDGGAFVTTQDTVIGLQALATYQMWVETIVPPPATNINIMFTAENTRLADVSEPQFQGLTEANARIREEFIVEPDVINHQSVTVTATGNGEGVVSYRCIYRSEVEEEPCHFEIIQNVEVTNELQFAEETEPRKIKLTLSVRANNTATGMSIIEVGLMSGFAPVEQTVLRLSRDEAVDGIIQRYEITNVSIIFYVEEISNVDPLVLAFDMEQRIPVDQPQPAKIYVYDYYEPSIHCGVFYAMRDARTDILTSNCDDNDADDDFCTCAEGGCVTCRTREDQYRRTACVNGDSGNNCNSCESDQSCIDLSMEACQRNYVYEVDVTSVSQPISASSEFFSFKADISRVLIHGDVEGLQKDSSATFIVRNDCLDSCTDDNLDPPDRNLNEFSNIIKVGGKLLIMGRPAERFLDRNREEAFQFRLDDEAIVERIFPQERCDRNRRLWEDFRCGTPEVNPRRIRRCASLKNQIAGCDNQDALYRTLEQGCG